MQIPPSVDDEPIIDIKTLVNFASFVWHAVLRRRKMIIKTVAITMIFVSVLCVLLPRVYKITTRILTHKNLLMTALVHPDRAIPQAADAPTVGAIELIKSRENLETLMQEVKLQEIWEKKRSFFYKFKDNALKLVLGKPNQVDVHEAFLKLLEDKITAKVEDDVVLIDVEWPDPDIAMSLADGVVKRFLKMRYNMELREILETVNILERNIDISRVNIEKLVGRMQKLFNVREAELQGHPGSADTHVKKTRFVAIRKPAVADHSDTAVEDLKKILLDKRSQIAGIKRNLEQSVKKAEENLADLRSSLGPEHPDVLEAKHNLEALSKPPLELLELQQAEDRLVTQISGASVLHAQTSDTSAEAITFTSNSNAVSNKKISSNEDAFDTVRVAVSEDLFKQLNADPEIMSVMAELKRRQESHDDLLRRLNNARIESETANVAFEYRYILTMPPIYPKKAITPNVPLLLGGGFVVSLLMGIFFAVAADVLSKRIFHAWQIKYFLNVKLLGEIDDSSHIL